MTISAKTEEIVDAIEAAVADGDTIFPGVFTYCYSRFHTPAAFHLALKRGIITRAYISVNGVHVYRKALRIAKAGGAA